MTKPRILLSLALALSATACKAQNVREDALKDEASAAMSCPAASLKLGGKDDDLDRTVDGCGASKVFHWDRDNMRWKVKP